MRPDYGPHFLIASEEEAFSGADSVELDGVNAFAAWDVDSHGLGAEELAVLYCVATGVPNNMNILDSFAEVFARDEMHGPWLVRLHEQFVSALAALGEEQIETIGQRWLNASENFQYRQAPQEWVQGLGFRLAKLAKLAINQNRALYWEPESC